MFKGTGTALVTPFTDSGEIDWDAFETLVASQIEGGIDALVACGTTGEPSTLTLAEQGEVIRFVLDQSAGRVPVIAGIGGNNTAEVAALAAEYSFLDLAGLLAVTPYYNKTTQEGLIAHYTTVADASSLPIIVYNVPARTGLCIQPETMGVLADHPRIAALKEASGSLPLVMEMFRVVGDRLHIFSGNDDQVYPMLALGGRGVISVMSNLFPELMGGITSAYFAGDQKQALKRQLELLPLINLLFAQVSPVPVKAAMAEVGLIGNNLRLPLVPLSEALASPLLAEVRAWA